MYAAMSSSYGLMNTNAIINPSTSHHHHNYVIESPSSSSSNKYSTTSLLDVGVNNNDYGNNNGATAALLPSYHTNSHLSQNGTHIIGQISSSTSNGNGNSSLIQQQQDYYTSSYRPQSSNYSFHDNLYRSSHYTPTSSSASCAYTCHGSLNGPLYSAQIPLSNTGVQQQQLSSTEVTSSSQILGSLDHYGLSSVSPCQQQQQSPSSTNSPDLQQQHLYTNNLASHHLEQTQQQAEKSNQPPPVIYPWMRKVHINNP
ncbi:unnamed protein product, partial [Didymodactylos carnosus]